MARIYTKTGDQGETSLVDGERVSKTHPRLEATGTVDELNATIGMAVAQLRNAPMLFVAELHQIQNELFNLGSRLACEKASVLERLPKINEDCVERLEKQIDSHSAPLPPLNEFVLPGGSEGAAVIHLARTICRRAERDLLRLQKDIDPILGKYLNRLSDYLFVLARAINHQQKVKETTWKK